MNDLGFIRQVFKDNNLGKGDYFKCKHFTIITRPGIEKIIEKQDIVIEEELVGFSEKYAGFKGVAYYRARPDEKIATYAAANSENTKQGWYLEVAIKRLRSRLTLMLIGMYDGNTLGQAEITEEIDEDATIKQIVYIERLIVTSALDEREKEQLDVELRSMKSNRAGELIAYLQENQLDPITQGANPSQTEANTYERKE